MSDWKSALKTLKREMFGVKGEGDSPAKGEPVRNFVCEA